MYAEDFNTVSFCFSKGMGCPVGSVLVGSEEDMWYARNMRKMLGGGMRQAGITASCILVALEDWEEKLSVDNKNALYLATELKQLEGIDCHLLPQTNMFTFEMN